MYVNCDNYVMTFVNEHLMMFLRETLVLCRMSVCSHNDLVCNPLHGPKLHWRGKDESDMKRFHIDEKNWFKIARDPSLWSNTCTIKSFNNVTFNGSQSAEQQIAFYVCNTCARYYRRLQIIARHKCDVIRYNRVTSSH